MIKKISVFQIEKAAEIILKKMYGHDLMTLKHYEHLFSNPLLLLEIPPKTGKNNPLRQLRGLAIEKVLSDEGFDVKNNCWVLRGVTGKWALICGEAA